MKNYRAFLFLLVFALVLTGFAAVSETALAAPQVIINSADVSGSTLSASGDVAAAIFHCSDDGTTSDDPACFCCNVEVVQPGFDGYNTCEITQTRYRILNKNTGTNVVHWTDLNDNLSPSSCPSSCGSSCAQDGSFSLSRSLPTGDYRLYVRSDDECGEAASDTFDFSVVDAPTASCSVSPDPAVVGQTVTWTGSASGGTGTGYEYKFREDGVDVQNWSTDNTYERSYSSSGSKSMNIRVRDSDGQWSSNTAVCSVQVVADDTPPLVPVQCSPQQEATVKGNSITFQASEGSGDYRWESSVGVSPQTAESGSSFSPTFTSGKFSTVRAVDNVTDEQNQCGIDVIDIMANNSDGPISITLGDSVTLSWNFGLRTSSHSYSCSASGAWSGSKAPNGGSNLTYATQSVTPNSTGQKTYRITCSNNTNNTGPVSDNVVVNVEEEEVTTGTINVTSNLATTWTGTGPESFSQFSNTTSRTFTDMDAGQYQIYPAAKSGYTYTVAPQSSQTLSGGSSITFDITYTEEPVEEGNDASCVGISAPDTVAPGENFEATITMGNTGTKAWTSDSTPHRLGSYNPRGNTTWGVARINLPSSPINPGQNAAFTRTFTAPSTTGVYNFDWQMVEETVEWFGQACTSHNITVEEETTGTINVTSNISTSWTITGGPGYSGSGTSATYNDAPTDTYTIAPADIPGWSYTVAPSSSQTLNGGATITFDITYTDNDEGGGALSCTPYHQSVDFGETASFGASGGTGNYSWSAPTGSPSSGSGVLFETAYSSGGLPQKKVTLSDGSNSVDCFVSASQSGNDLPRGTHDTADDATCTISGWATDPDNRNTDLTVNVHVDGSLATTVVADDYRSDLETYNGAGICPGGTCAFNLPMYGMVNPGTTHSVRTAAVDTQTGAERDLNLTPRNLTCSATPDFFLSSSNDLKIESDDGTGTSNETTITVTPVNDFNSNVSLSVTDSPLPGDTNYNFGDPTLSPSEYSTGSSFSVRLNTPTAAGIYPIEITGTGGGLSRTVNVNLLVNTGGVRFEEF